MQDNDATPRRKAKLRAWIDREFEGNVAMFVRHYKLKPSMASYISQLFSGLRGFGEKSARNVERAAGKPDGWLDAEGDKLDEPVLKVQHILNCDMDAVAKLPARYRETISDFIGYVLTRHSRENSVIESTSAVLSINRQTAPANPASSRKITTRKASKTLAIGSSSRESPKKAVR